MDQQHTCVRCGKPCAPGEVMCPACAKWFQEQTKATPGGFRKENRPSFQRAGIFQKPAAPQNTPAAPQRASAAPGDEAPRQSPQQADDTDLPGEAPEEEAAASQGGGPGGPSAPAGGPAPAPKKAPRRTSGGGNGMPKKTRLLIAGAAALVVIVLVVVLGLSAKVGTAKKSSASSSAKSGKASVSATSQTTTAKETTASTSVYCQNCQKAVPKDALYCPYCGADMKTGKVPGTETTTKAAAAATKAAETTTATTKAELQIKVSDQAPAGAGQRLVPTGCFESSIVKQSGHYDNSADAAVDGDTVTSWQEGVSGPGIGEYVAYDLDDSHQIKAFSFCLGNWRNSDYYAKNNTPTQLTITFDDNNSCVVDFPYGQTEYWVSFSQPQKASSVKITVDAVHAGTQYDDTCIAEIGIYGQ